MESSRLAEPEGQSTSEACTMRTGRTGGTRPVAPRLAWLLCILLTCVPHADSGAQTDGVLRDTIIRGLKWYFHWEKPFAQARSLRCRGQNFGENYFVFCDPGGESLDLTMDRAGEFNVNVITSTVDDFATQLRLFSQNRKGPAGMTFLFALASTDRRRTTLTQRRRENLWTQPSAPCRKQYDFMSSGATMFAAYFRSWLRAIPSTKFISPRETELTRYGCFPWPTAKYRIAGGGYTTFPTTTSPKPPSRIWPTPPGGTQHFLPDNQINPTTRTRISASNPSTNDHRCIRGKGQPGIAAPCGAR